MADEKTADDLIYEVAAILGKVVAGEELGQPEYKTIDGCIDQVLAEVGGIVAIGDRDAIPAVFFQTLARLTAIHAAAKFSSQPVDLDQVVRHENRLRYLAAGQPTYQVQKAVYF